MLVPEQPVRGRHSDWWKTFTNWKRHPQQLLVGGSTCSEVLIFVQLYIYIPGADRHVACCQQYCACCSKRPGFKVMTGRLTGLVLRINILKPISTRLLIYLLIILIQVTMPIPLSQSQGRYRQRVWPYIYIYIWSRPPSLHPPPPMGWWVGSPGSTPPSLLFASYWQHFWGPASYLLGLCSISDYKPRIY